MFAYTGKEKQKSSTSRTGTSGCNDKHLRHSVKHSSGLIMFASYDSCYRAPENIVIQRVKGKASQDNMMEEFTRLRSMAVLSAEDIASIEEVIRDEKADWMDFYRLLHRKMITAFEQEFQTIGIMEHTIVERYRSNCEYALDSLKSIETDTVGAMYEACRDSLNKFRTVIQMIEVVNQVATETRFQFEVSKMKIDDSIKKLERVVFLQQLIRWNGFDMPVAPLMITPDHENNFKEKAQLHEDEWGEYNEKYDEFIETMNGKIDTLVEKVIQRGIREWESLVKDKLTFQNSFDKTDPENEAYQRTCEEYMNVLTDALKTGYSNVIRERQSEGVDIQDKDIPVIVEKCVVRAVCVGNLKKILDVVVEMQNKYEMREWKDILHFNSESDRCYCNPCGTITAANAEIHCTLYKDVPVSYVHDIRTDKRKLHDDLLGVKPRMCFHVSSNSIEETNADGDKWDVANHAYRVGESVINMGVNNQYFPKIPYWVIEREMESIKDQQVREKEDLIDAFVDRKGIGSYHRKNISDYLTKGAWKKTDR